MDFIKHIKEENTPDNKKNLIKAYNYAWNYSPDNSTKIGTLLTQLNVNILGTNKFPNVDKTQVTPEMLERTYKYANIEHGEVNAIRKAKEQGFTVEGATLYTNLFPCDKCGEFIKNNKIGKVVFHLDMLLRLNEGADEYHTKSYNILNKAGVEMTYFSGKLGVKALQKGIEWDA